MENGLQYSLRSALFVLGLVKRVYY